jgi:hypothetical protein
MKATAGFPDGSIEDLRRSYGVNFEDPLQQESQAQLAHQRLTRHRKLGRLLMFVSRNDPAQTEQRMRDTIEPALGDTRHWGAYNAETGQFEAPVSPEPAQQQLDQQSIPDAPAEPVDYMPRHAAK